MDTTFACPGCATAMRRQVFGRKPLGTVEIDVCMDCQAIWFDRFESSQLTAGAILELFRLVKEASQARPRPASAPSHCPRCHRVLELTHDLQRTNHFTYMRCPEWHGRFITFLQFLREKQFVRSLSHAEIGRLRGTIAQVRCSSCGAPVDIEKGAECEYCHAPLAILDADAVKRTLDELSAEDQKERTGRDVAAAIDAVLPGQLQALESERRISRSGMDLVAEGIEIAIGLAIALR